MIKDPQVHWTTQPRQTMQYARFMAKIGMIPAAPANWKMFFPEIADQPGSSEAPRMTGPLLECAASRCSTRRATIS